MNIETLKERLNSTTFMSLIRNKKEKQEDLEQFKNKKDKLSMFQLILLGVGAVSSITIGYITHIYTSDPAVIGFFSFAFCSFFTSGIIAANQYKEIQYEKKLDMNSLLEEIKKELSDYTTQKIIIEYINALAITYPEFQILSNNIKKALIENNYHEANNCLELMLRKEDVMIKNTLIIIKEQENINKYEKELGVEILANKEMNNKEKEKGWTKLL